MGNARLRIVILEDEAAHAEAIRRAFEQSDLDSDISVAGTLKEYHELIGDRPPDMALLDLYLPDGRAVELLRSPPEDGLFPILIMTSFGSEQDAVEALKAGALDYVVKSAQAFIAMPRTVTRVLREWTLLQERKRAEEELRRAKEELEIRVRERTRELEHAYAELKRESEERVTAVEALREKEQLLVQQNRLAAMGDMIGNIAHQWRQPLNTLGLILQELRMTYGRDEFSKESLEQSVNKGMGLIRHMSQTIADFSNYFKPDKEKKLFNVNQAVAKTLYLIEPSLKNQEIQVEVLELAEIDINGYMQEYSQVLLNILINCRDAFEEGNISGPRVITITLYKENDRSVVTVADNAGGVSEDIIEKIFDPYFTTKGPDKGTGIGLFMAKAIIEKNMGGRLMMRNTADGAEFRIEV